MAIYPGAVLRLIALENPPRRATMRVVILHVAVSLADSLFSLFDHNPTGIESHFYIRLTGVVEQYRDTAFRADANMSANPFAISIETEGLGDGTWTPEQIAAIKALLLWCHATHPVPLVLCPAWDGAGVGYHILFMQEWAGGPRSCPGPDRVKQFHAVLVPWMSNPTVEDEMSQAQVDQIIARINLNQYILEQQIRPAVLATAQTVTGLTAAVAALARNPDITPEQMAAIVGAAVDKTLTDQVTVHGTLTVDPKGAA